MKKLCFVIQGTTFLKSVFTLILFANNHNIKPIIFCIKHRHGKPYDNLWNKKKYIENLIQKYNVICDIMWCDNQNQALEYMLKNNLNSVVCQDAHQHGKEFCNNLKIKVFSIGVGFDTLHHGNDIRLKKINHVTYPDVIYLADKKIKNKFLNLVGNYPSKIVTSGSPIFDHSLFIDKVDKKGKKIVTFFVTLQRLVNKNLQKEIEDFANFSKENNIIFNVKTKVKTPWVFKDKKTNSKINIFESEEGFPATSINLMLNSDLIISSYSTCSIEAEYFGIPNINIDSVEKKDLTYAVNSIKFDYNFNKMYESTICKTISCKLKEAYYEMINNQRKPKELITYANNSSQRILKDIKTYL
jgi:hypothetical protein